MSSGFDPTKAPGLAKTRLPLLLLSIIALLAGLWAGLLRIGWAWPPLQPTLIIEHGPLMISGFLGALIGLERAVGLQKRWGYLSPALTGIGGLLLVFGIGGWIGPALITAGSALLALILVQLLRIHLALFSIVIFLGGLVWFVGNGLWLLGWPIYQVILWWMGFLVLTIAGERLELSRMLRLSRLASALYLGATLLFVAGMTVSTVNYDLGMRVAGVGMVAMALWLLRYDIARRRIKAGGQAAFTGISLVSGYVWLAVGGGLALYYGGVMAGPYYDAILHTVFLGFTFTMIFAHAPIIFPAVLQVRMVYLPRFYSHLILLHVTLIMRVAGDLLGLWELRRWGGLLNALVLLLFLANTISSVRLKRD